MAQATPTTEGEIVLSGDFAGGVDANFPQLRASGVTPGFYQLSSRSTVDAKGRVISVSSMVGIDKTDINQALDAAYAQDPSQFNPGANGYTHIPKAASASTIATTTTPGYAAAGSGFNIVDGVVSVPVASTTVFGELMVPENTGFSVTDGTLSLLSSNMLPATGGEVQKQFQPNIPDFVQTPGDTTWTTYSQTLISPQMSYNTTKMDFINIRSTYTPSTLQAQATTGTKMCVVYRPVTDSPLRIYSSVSTDGINWSKLEFPANAPIYTIPNGGTYVTMAADDTSFVMYGMTTTEDAGTAPYSWWTAKSTDGLNWTFTTQPVTNLVLRGGIVYGSGVFMIVGTHYSTGLMSFLTSTDGVNWTTTASTLTPANTSFSGLVYDGTTFHVAFNATGGAFGGTRKYYTRGNTGSWVDRSALFPATCIFELMATNGTGTAVVFVRTTTTANSFYYSTNGGAAWTSTPNIAGSPVWTGLNWLATRFMAVMQTTSTNFTQVTAVSPTGATWTTGPIGPGGSGDALKLGSKYIMAEAAKHGNRPYRASEGQPVNQDYLFTQDNGSTWTIGNNTRSLNSTTVFPRGAFVEFINSGVITQKINLEIYNTSFSPGFMHRTIVNTLGRKFNIYPISGSGTTQTIKVSGGPILTEDNKPTIILFVYLSANTWLAVKE